MKRVLNLGLNLYPSPRVCACVSSDAIGEKREKANAKAVPKIDTPYPRITTGETSRSPFLVNKSSSCRWTGGGAFLTQPTDWPDTARHLPRHGLRTVGTVKRVLRKNDACPIEMQCFAMVAWNRSIRIEALRLDWGIRPRPEVRKVARADLSQQQCMHTGGLWLSLWIMTKFIAPLCMATACPRWPSFAGFDFEKLAADCQPACFDWLIEMNVLAHCEWRLKVTHTLVPLGIDFWDEWSGRLIVHAVHNYRFWQCVGGRGMNVGCTKSAFVFIHRRNVGLWRHRGVLLSEQM